MTRNNGGAVHPVKRQVAKARTPDPSLPGSPSPSAAQAAAADGSLSTRTSHWCLVDREDHDRASVAQTAALLLAHPCKTAGRALVQSTSPPRPPVTVPAGLAARQSEPEALRRETRRPRRLPGQPMQHSDCKYACSCSGGTEQLIRCAMQNPRQSWRMRPPRWPRVSAAAALQDARLRRVSCTRCTCTRQRPESTPRKESTAHAVVGRPSKPCYREM